MTAPTCSITWSLATKPTGEPATITTTSTCPTSGSRGDRGPPPHPGPEEPHHRRGRVVGGPGPGGHRRGRAGPGRHPSHVDHPGVVPGPPGAPDHPGRGWGLRGRLRGLSCGQGDPMILAQSSILLPLAWGVLFMALVI